MLATLAAVLVLSCPIDWDYFQDMAEFYELESIAPAQTPTPILEDERS